MPQDPKIDWTHLPDVDLKGLPDDNPPEEPGLLSKAYHALADPLTTAPSRWADELATSMTDPNKNPGWFTGFGAGALKGIGDLASGLTSPFNLALTVATGGEAAAGKAGYEGLASLFNTAGKVIGVPTGIHGIADILSPDSTIGERFMGGAELAGSAIPFAHEPIKPVIKINPEIVKRIKETDENIHPESMPPDEIDNLLDSLSTKSRPLSAEAQAASHTHEVPSGDIEELLKGLPDQHLELRDEGPTTINGSGDSSASMEALNRQASMKANGQQFVVYDKTGNVRPLIGPDAVDYVPAKGESKGITGPNGFQLLDDNGGLHPAKLNAKIAAIEKNVATKGSASDDTQKLLADLKGKSQAQVTTTPGQPNVIYIKKVDPEVIKQAMQKGYVLDKENPIRDDGAYKMVKSQRPVTNLPILESETLRPNARPTPANAARMTGGMPPSKLPPSNPMGGGGEIPDRGSIAKEVINFPRTIMASTDFSAPLRQGLPLIHKKAFWTSLDDMFKAFGSKQSYDAIQQGILDRPLFKPRITPSGPVKSFAEEAGLKLTDMKSLSSREEAIMSNYADKVPGVARSNRAYTAFLNKLRADTFEDLINKSKVFGADGTTNLPLARALADFVNTASGRGSLNFGKVAGIDLNLEKSASTLNTLLFSPRLIASRLKMLNPATYIMANPIVRKEYLKSLLAVAGVGNTILQLGKMAGGTIESDPASSDYGKLKIGNVRLDPWGGFQQYIVAANRLIRPASMSADISTDSPIAPLDMATGMISGGGHRIKSSSNGKEYDLMNPHGPYDPTMLGTMARFGQGKLNPVLGFAVALLNGSKEMSGQKMDFTTLNPMNNAITQRFIPIVMQDIYSIYQEDPSLLPALGPASLFGMGTQVYGGGKQ